MKITKIIALTATLFGLLALGIATGIFYNKQALPVEAAPPLQQQDYELIDAKDDDEEGDVLLEDDDADDEAETEEAVSPDEAGITAAEAQAAAEAAYQGTKAIEVELERENGQVMYEVELDNGLEVMVDADNGDILGAEQDDD